MPRPPAGPAAATTTGQGRGHGPATASHRHTQRLSSASCVRHQPLKLSQTLSLAFFCQLADHEGATTALEAARAARPCSSCPAPPRLSRPSTTDKLHGSTPYQRDSRPRKTQPMQILIAKPAPAASPSTVAVLQPRTQPVLTWSLAARIPNPSSQHRSLQIRSRLRLTRPSHCQEARAAASTREERGAAPMPPAGLRMEQPLPQCQAQATSTALKVDKFRLNHCK